MNKLFTKIAALTLGATMAVGVGVAVASSPREAKSADAATSTLTISGSDFNTTSYAANNGNHTTGSIGWYSNQVMKNGTNMQWQKNNGYIYNTTDLGTIKSVTVNKSAGSFTTYYGTSEHPTSGTTVGGGFFTVKVGNATGTTSSIVVTYSSGSETTYTVTYNSTNADGGTAPSGGSYASGATVTVAGNTGSLTRSGYTWAGWSLNSDGSGTAYGPGYTTTYTMPAYAVNFYPIWEEESSGGSGDYEKASSIAVGDTILLVYETGKYELNGISTTSTKYGLGVTYSTTPNGAYELTVEAGNADGYFSFKHGSDYLDLPTSSNVLNKTTTKGDTSSWTVTFSSGNAVITNKSYTGRSIKWNNTSGQYRFACYTSGQQAVQIYKKTTSDPTVSIETASTSVTWNGTSTQTIAFTATATHFSDNPGDIAYEWRTSNASAISVTGVGSNSTANLKVVGAGSATITCYALGLSDDEATSEGVTVTVTNETYSGVLTITTDGDILTGDSGNIEYTLTGNTHPMNTYSITSTDDDVIAVNYNQSTGKFEYVAGDTPNATATVTITLSSSVYTLETYQKTLSVRLVDSSAVSSVTTNYNTRNPKIGGSNLSIVATVTLVGGGDATGKQVTWTPADTGVCTISASVDTLTGTIVPVNVGTTTVRVASVDDPTKYHDVTVNVSGPDSKTLNSITINKGDGYKTTYYDDAESVDLTGLSLTANYINSNYPTYSENVAVANDASGVVWTLDLTNEKVKVAYTVDQTTVRDEFAITVTEAPSVVTIVSSALGISDQTDASGSYIVSPFTVTFAQNGGSNPPKYYSNGASVRMYASNTLVISSDETVETIDSIVITVHESKTSFEISTNSGGSCSGSGLEYTFTGTNEITFTAGSAQFRPVTIEISYTKVEAQDKDVESVSVSPLSASVESGKTTNLSVEVLPADARDITVTWESDDESVATVDENGVVTGVAPGTATITATSNDQPSISDSATITVTAGPVVEFTTTSAINNESGSQVYLGNAFFNLTVEGGTYRGGEARGAQFSSSKTAVDVGLEVTDIAVATQDLRVIVDASRNSNGTATLGVKIGSTDLLCDSSSSVTLSGESTEYEFTYSGTSSSTVVLSNLINVSLSNDGGAIFVKSIRVYSAASQSVIGDFTANSLRMDSYDKGGSEGSTGGNGSCKAWWSGVLSTYNGLTDGQKALFCGEDQYIAARARLNEWSRINGYSFDSTTGSLSQSLRISPLSIITSNSNTVSIIVVISLVSVTAIGGYFFLRKRKEN